MLALFRENFTQKSSGFQRSCPPFPQERQTVPLMAWVSRKVEDEMLL